MYDPYIEHSGVKGMKWGVRRYQNYDGSLTSAGRAHYGVGPARKFKSTVGGALKKVGKGAKAASKGVVKSTSSLLKKIKTKSEDRKEERLQKAIATGNVKNILKGISSMSDKELNDALNRARNVKALKDLKGPKKSMTEKLGDVANTVTKGAVAVQNIAKARQERLKYREAQDKYDREEEKRDEEERKAWQEKHANDKKKINDILGDMKTRAGEMKRKLDDWEPYDTNTAKPSKKKNKESLRDKVNRLNADIERSRAPGEKPKELTGSITRLLTGPSYTPNFTRRNSSSTVYQPGRSIAGLIPDLSKPKSSSKKENDLMAEILDMTARRKKNSGNGSDADPDEYVRRKLKGNRKRLRDLGYM